MLIIIVIILISIIYVILNTDLRIIIHYFYKSKLEIIHIGNYDIIFGKEFLDTYMYSIYEETLTIGVTSKLIDEWYEYFNNCEDTIKNRLVKKDFEKAVKLINNAKSK